MTLAPSIFVMAFVSTLLLSGPLTAAIASDLPEPKTERDLIADLSEFVSQETGFPPLLYQPEIASTSASTLNVLLVPSQAHEGDHPLAAYMPQSHRILVERHLDLKSPYGRSYLVHELVHASQYTSGTAKRAPCRGWLEGEAYRVQARYLESKGESETARKLLFMGLLQSACGHAYHPELAGR